MCNNNDKIIQVDIDDVILTPVTCARIINEVLKSLIYQKSQIPYPYNWLENVINKKRRSGEGPGKMNLTAQRNFQSASSAYDALEEIMRNIVSEFTGCTSNFYEVVIVFGPTPLTPKEVYTIRIPIVARGHLEMNHQNTQKSQHKILRDIFLSETWLNSMEGFLPSTNMYLMLNKSTALNTKGFFVESTKCIHSKNIKNTIINLIYNRNNDTCCEHLQVFEDDDLSSTDKRTIDISSANVISEGTWYQAKVLVKGFKDCFINKVSASELW